LRAIVEAFANGIAVKKAWSQTKSVFRENWSEAIGLSFGEKDLGRIELVVAAPSAYWNIVLSNEAKRVADSTPIAARGPIKDLLRRMEKEGFPLSMIEINSSGDIGKDNLPDVSGARLVDFP
jgi:hypothetical protein